MNGELKRKIYELRDLLVGVVPVPTDQGQADHLLADLQVHGRHGRAQPIQAMGIKAGRLNGSH